MSSHIDLVNSTIDEENTIEGKSYNELLHENRELNKKLMAERNHSFELLARLMYKNKVVNEAIVELLLIALSSFTHRDKANKIYNVILVLRDGMSDKPKVDEIPF